MKTYVALLRGINVSGHNAIRMPELQASFSGLGFADVRTYLQSGNVVFSAGKSNESKLAAAIQARIKQDFGLEVPVLVMSANELEQVANANPLWPKAGGDEKLFHSTFLAEPVSPDRFEALKLPAAAGERAVLVGRAVLLHCPHGYGKTKLNNSYFERALGVTATTRNWRTVLALQQLSSEVR
jgi:uncharacterized protein (DUF1697 family)